MQIRFSEMLINPIGAAMANTGMCNGVKIKQIDLAPRGKRRIVKPFSTRLIIAPLSVVFTRFSDSKVSKMRVIYRCDSSP